MKRQSARRYERTDSVQSTTWETVRLGDFLTLKRGYDLSSSRRVTGPSRLYPRPESPDTITSPKSWGRA